MYRLPFSIVSRAHIVAPTVLGSPIAFVERGVGRASGRSEASPVVSVVLAHAAALVRTIHVVREEFAVPGRLAYRLAGLRGECAVGKARRATAAALARHPGTTSGELLVEVDVVIARSRLFGIVFRRKVSTPLGQLKVRDSGDLDALRKFQRKLGLPDS